MTPARPGRRHSLPSALALAVLLAAFVPASTRGQAQPPAAPPPTALLGATLIDGTGAAPVADAVVVVRDGRIECAGSPDRCRVPGDAERVDLAGKWIIPGLVDAHVHYSQTGWADGRPDALDMRDRFPYDSTIAVNRADPERYYRAHLCSGVTATFDVGGFPWTWGLRDDAEASTSSPHVAAAGPLLSTADHWLNVPGARQFMHIPTDSAVDAGARYVILNGTDAVKVWFLHGESSPGAADYADRVMRAGEIARRRGVPLIVHATGLWQAKAAVRAGARLLVHSVYADPVDDEFLDLARRAGTIYNPTLVVHEGYTQLRARDFDAGAYGDGLRCVDPATRAKAFLTDSLPGAASPEQIARMRQRDDARARLMADNLARVRAAGIPVAMGTDAGNPLTLHGPSVYLEMEAMAAAGMSPMEVLVSSTRVAADAMGRLADLGTLEAGKVADLVVLGANPLADVRNVRRVERVMRGGKLWRRVELEW